MDAISMNSRNKKTSDLQSFRWNKLEEKKYVALSNFSTYYTWKNIKKSYKNNKFQISAPSFLMDHILYQIFKITFNAWDNETISKY